MTEATTAQRAHKSKLVGISVLRRAFARAGLRGRLPDGWHGLASRAAVLSTAAAYYGSGLGRREVSLLESQDLGIASDLFKTYALSPDHSPLHFIFLELWQRFNATSVAFLRVPSVFFCAAAAVVIFCLADAIAGRVAGFFAAAFMIFNARRRGCRPLDAPLFAVRAGLVALLLVCAFLPCTWAAAAPFTRFRNFRDPRRIHAPICVAAGGTARCVVRARHRMHLEKPRRAASTQIRADYRGRAVAPVRARSFHCCLRARAARSVPGDRERRSRLPDHDRAHAVPW